MKAENRFSKRETLTLSRSILYCLYAIKVTINPKMTVLNEEIISYKFMLPSLPISYLDRLFDNTNFFISQSIQIIYKSIDFPVCGINLALDHFLFSSDSSFCFMFM